jgi:hypothetical protein
LNKCFFCVTLNSSATEAIEGDLEMRQLILIAAALLASTGVAAANCQRPICNGVFACAGPMRAYEACLKLEQMVRQQQQLQQQRNNVRPSNNSNGGYRPRNDYECDAPAGASCVTPD